VCPITDNFWDLCHIAVKKLSVVVKNSKSKTVSNTTSKSVLCSSAMSSWHEFAIALLMIMQEDMASYQLISHSIFEIDPVLDKIRSLNGVKGAEVFIPFRVQIYQDWILREIDNRVNHKRESLVLI
jgi:hypothetical protein